MSIQDESFPNDELEMSRNSGQNVMIFPHHMPRASKLALDDRVIKNSHEMLNVNLEKEKEEVESSCNQDDSTQSSNDCPPELETSGKTNASEPTEMPDIEPESKKSQYSRNTQNKSVSYQDIHSEYTKRRFKHVESKVGQYIANIKALDEKRRNTGKFQRHRSMPETLSGPNAGESVPELHGTPKKVGLLRHSTNDLDHIHDQESHSDHETENYDNLTATTSSSSRELGQDAGIYLDKQTYDQWLSDKERHEYVQTKLQEKDAENWRLKKNLDTMRIEYTRCKDKLKQLNQNHRMSGSFGMTSVGAFGRNSLSSLLYPQETKDKSTQTENILTPSPVPVLTNGNDIFATPLTPDSNNNSFDHAAMGMLAPAALKVAKTVATIQPLSLNFSNVMESENSRDYSINNTMGFLRHRSNSIGMRKKSTPLPVAVANTSKTSTTDSSVPSSDSAIDIEVIESPRSQRQSRREEFVYYEKRSQRYAILDGRSNAAGRSFTETESNLSTVVAAGSRSAEDNYGGRSKKLRNRLTLRTRIKRLFGACTKCDDPNMSMDTLGNSQQQSFSQIPLLEKSSLNPRHNLR